jgi:ribonuclease HI
MSYAAPGMDTACIEKAMKWALWSAQNAQQKTATLVAIPRSRTAKGRPVYDEWIEQYPKCCTHLTTVRHADTPMYMGDLWWSTGPADTLTKHCDLDLVLVSNLPAHAHLGQDSGWLYDLLAAVACINGQPLRPAARTRTRALASRVLSAWTKAWQQQDQSMGIMTTPSDKFKKAAEEPVPLQADAPDQLPPDALRQAHPASPLLYDWRSLAYTDGSKMEVTDGDIRRTAVGAGLYIPSLEEQGEKAEFTVDPAGAGPTNTINRAELAGIHAALEKGQGAIATDSATSIAQLQRAVHRPGTLKLHKHADLLRSLVRLLRNSPGAVTIAKIRAHAGHIGNEVADLVAKRAAIPEDDSEPDMVLPVSSEASQTAGYWPYRTAGQGRL